MRKFTKRLLNKIIYNNVLLPLLFYIVERSATEHVSKMKAFNMDVNEPVKIVNPQRTPLEKKAIAQDFVLESDIVREYEVDPTKTLRLAILHYSCSIKTFTYLTKKKL